MLTPTERFLTTIAAMFMVALLIRRDTLNSAWGKHVFIGLIALSLWLLMEVRSHNRNETKHALEEKGVNVKKAMLYSYIAGIIVVAWFYWQWQIKSKNNNYVWLFVLMAALMLVHYWVYWGLCNNHDFCLGSRNKAMT